MHLWETHLVVGDLQRSRAFYEQLLGLRCARASADVCFLWIGEGRHCMLGLWQRRPTMPPGPPTTPDVTQLVAQHLALAVEPEELPQRMARLRAHGVAFWGMRGPAGDGEEPVVHAWVPAASIYFQDPGGHCLEYLALLPDPPRPEAGMVPWSLWRP